MKTKSIFIKFAAMFLLLAIMASSFVACKKDDSIDPNGENVTKLSFKAASGYELSKSAWRNARDHQRLYGDKLTCWRLVYVFDEPTVSELSLLRT